MQKLSFKVNIMDRDFTVACREGEQDQLVAAAAYLDDIMRSIQQSGKVIGHERCAIMAALNISNELLHGQGGTEGRSLETSVSAEVDNSATQEKIDSLTRRIESALDD